MIDAFPVEACKELQVRVFHRVGHQQCVLTLHVQASDDVQARVLQAFQRGTLPSCLYRSTLEYATLAVRDSLSDDDQHVFHVTPLSQWSNGGISHDRGWPRSLVKDIADANAGAAVLPRRDETFWYAFDFLLRHRPTFFRTIGTLEESYLKGIRELQGCLRRAISQLQMRQSMEMEQVRQRAEKAALQVAVDDSEAGLSRNVQDLVAQHVGELDAVELHWRTEIEELKVRQKASYCDLVVDFFEQEIDQLVAASEENGCPLKPFGAGPEASPTAASAAADEPDSDSELQRVTDHDSDRAERGTSGESRGDLKVRAEVRAVFGQRRVFFVLRLFVGDITDLLPDASPPVEDEDGEDGPGPSGGCCGGSGAGVSGRFAVAADDDGAGPQLPPELVGLGSYGQRHFVCGSGAPVVGWPPIWPPQGMGFAAGICASTGGNAAAAGPTTFGGCASGQQTTSGGGAVGSAGGGLVGVGRAARAATFRSPSLRFWAPPRLPPPVGLSPNAYADSLRSVIIPTPENLKFEATQAVMLREFAARCDRVTDLHFRPLAEQLQAVKMATCATPLKSGDYFCTRHSNLGGTVQVAFHLFTGSSEALASDEVPAATHRALRRIVGDCHRCHVAELTLPLLLLDIGTSESSLPYAVAQRRSENALRALKGALTRLAEELAPSELPELQVVNLVLPASSAQSISAGIPSVAESALTFLRNSFQCV